MITVNGKEYPFVENVNFKDFLESEGYKTERVALELNGEILPKSEFASTLIRDRDKVEIVCFVGGG